MSDTSRPRFPLCPPYVFCLLHLGYHSQMRGAHTDNPLSALQRPYTTSANGVILTVIRYRQHPTRPLLAATTTNLYHLRDLLPDDFTKLKRGFWRIDRRTGHRYP